MGANGTRQGLQTGGPKAPPNVLFSPHGVLNIFKLLCLKIIKFHLKKKFCFLAPLPLFPTWSQVMAGPLKVVPITTHPSPTLLLQATEFATPALK